MPGIPDVIDGIDQAADRREEVGMVSEGITVLLRGVGVCVFGLTALSLLAGAEAGDEVEDAFKEDRERMVREDIAGKPWSLRTPVKDGPVLAAMRTVPRHEFVPEKARARAYGDYPLPIGYGQTISQPYIVAYMTEMLKPRGDSVVLEIGTGSGYQAAVLGRIAKEVYTIEIVPELGEAAQTRLQRLGYENVHARVGDGYYGWPEHGPYDGIIVTAAASHIPPPLVEQLKPGGRMAIPVGPPFQVQSLMLIEKQPDGAVVQRNVMSVRFVPLTRSKGGSSSTKPDPGEDR